MQHKKVSVIIPTYNEAQFISRAIESLLETDYTSDLLEFVIVDGNSTDKTREIVEELARQQNVNIKLLNNPNHLTSVSLNMGIAGSTGEIIIRADAHSQYPSHYIDQLIYWKEKLGADNVGGVFVHTALRNTKINNAIIAVLDSPFGVGNATYRLVRSGQPIRVDTVPYGIWDRELFDSIGLFNEKLVRNQDIELNKRILANGGKIFLLPFLHIKYYPRSTWRDFIKYSMENGKWNVLTIFITRNLRALNIRHFVPLFFVLSLVGTLILGIFKKIFFALFVLIIILYFAAAIVAALKSKRDNTTIWHVVVTFFLWHFFYGIGETWGFVCALRMKRYSSVNTNN